MPALAAAPKAKPATGFALEHVVLERRIGHDRLYVLAEATGGVTFAVEDGHRSVIYSSPEGELDGKTITADFGWRGSPWLTLDGTVRRSRRCGHRTETIRTFRGDFEFHGEGGFLDFHLHSMPGEVQTLATCPGVHPRQAPAPRGEEQPATPAAVTDVRPLPGGEPGRDRRPDRGWHILRRGRSQFTWDHQKGTATVRPPAPFEGQMLYHRHPEDGAPKITGNLRVPTLGGPDVTVAGSHFKATLTNEPPDDE